jgi:hypothetical protein
MSIDKTKKPKRPGADRRWTLLFIGDHGNVITLKHFKAVVIGIGSLFVLAVVFAAVLFIQNQEIHKQNNDLQKRFADSNKQIEKLRHEKEILMARLVRAEVKTKEKIAEEPQIPKKTKAAQARPPSPQVASKPKPKPVKAVEKKSAVPQTASPSPPPAETDEDEPVISVAVENFKVSRESYNQSLNARFKIKNTSTGLKPQKVAGRVIVVLKGEGLSIDQWLVMPAVGLAGGKPSGKRGRSFSIQRFYTMNLASKAPNYSDQFETAAVYVFNKTGELLLEQDFSINLPPAPIPSAGTPSTQTASGKRPSSSEPSGETPESGDATDSLNSMPPVF